VKRSFLLAFALIGIWFLWSEPSMAYALGSGHHLFVLFLGLVSIVLVVLLANRMQIIDDEGTPLNMGLRPISYVLWLLKEIVVANIQVARVIVDPKLPIKPRMVRVKANQKTTLGRVILANSITLTPGTVSVNLNGDKIDIHALSFEGAEDDLSGDMDRRVCALEG